MTDAPEGPTFIDNAHAPDLFADGATGFFIVGNTIRITLEAARVNHSTSPGPVNRVVIGRLVMTSEGAEGLARGLLDFIERQKNATTPHSQSPARLN